LESSIVAVTLFTTEIVFPIEKNIVVITARKEKFTRVSLSLNPKVFIIIVLNLKLIFHPKRNPKLISNIIIVVKNEPLRIQIPYPSPETGDILTTGKK
jgi:hypothetical protein